MHHSQRIWNLLSLSLHVPDLWDCIYSNVNPFLPHHRVYRVPGFLSSRPNWVCCSSPPLSPRGETHPLAGEGGWGTLFRRRVFYVYCNPTCGRDICCSSSEWGSYDTVVIFGLRNCSFIRILQTRPEGGRGERKGVSPLCLSVLADGHLVSGLNWSLGDGVHSAFIIFRRGSQNFRYD